MSYYEEQLKVWASKKYNIPVEQIKSVYLDNEYDDLGSGCDTCGYGGVKLYYYVSVYGSKNKILQRAELHIDFSTLLKEILEA